MSRSNHGVASTSERKFQEKATPEIAKPAPERNCSTGRRLPRGIPQVSVKMHSTVWILFCSMILAQSAIVFGAEAVCDAMVPHL